MTRNREVGCLVEDDLSSVSRKTYRHFTMALNPTVIHGIFVL
jgi:hypothetical protein